MGAVLFDAKDGAIEFWGGLAAGWLVNEWQSQGNRQVIEQAEAAPVAISRHTWSHRLTNRLIVHYLDNDGARHGFIKGSSENPLTQVLVNTVLRQEETLRCRSWYARVPSAGNCADAPSRPEEAMPQWLLRAGRQVTPRGLPEWKEEFLQEEAKSHTHTRQERVGVDGVVSARTERTLG